MHDAKGPLLAVWARGWDLAGLTSDTQLAAYLTRPDQRTFDLADLTIRYLKRELRVEGAPDLDDPNQLALDFGDDDSGAKVAAEASMVRARAVIDLADALDVDIEQRNGTSLLYGVELPLLRTLARMEQTEWLWMSIIWRPWRRGLLPPSTVPRAMRTRCWASRSTSAHPSSSRLCCSTNWECRRPGVPAPAIRPMPTLQQLYVKTEHPFLAHLLVHRDAIRLKQTVEGLLKAVADDGRIHTTYAQTIAATGGSPAPTPTCRTFPFAPRKAAASGRHSWWARDMTH